MLVSELDWHVPAELWRRSIQERRGPSNTRSTSFVGIAAVVLLAGCEAAAAAAG